MLSPICAIQIMREEVMPSIGRESLDLCLQARAKSNKQTGINGCIFDKG